MGGGFCHCDEGYFGIDCSIENAAAQTAADLMDVSTVHERLLAAREPDELRLKLCFIAGLLQVSIYRS